MYMFNLNICHIHIVLINSVTDTFVWQVNNNKEESNALDFKMISNREKLTLRTLEIHWIYSFYIQLSGPF